MLPCAAGNLRPQVQPQFTRFTSLLPNRLLAFIFILLKRSSGEGCLSRGHVARNVQLFDEG